MSQITFEADLDIISLVIFPQFVALKTTKILKKLPKYHYHTLDIDSFFSSNMYFILLVNLNFILGFLASFCSLKSSYNFQTPVTDMATF